MGKGAKGGLDWDGGVRYLCICFICLGQDINWDIVLSPAPVAILILFILILFHFLTQLEMFETNVCAHFILFHLFILPNVFYIFM